MSMFSMPTSFADFWERSKKTAPYIYTLGGALFISVGTFMYLSQERYIRSAVPVSLEVTDMVEGSEGGYAPEFVVLDGANEGRRYRGNTYINPPAHSIGDRVPGLINTDTGVIKSDRMIAQIKWMGSAAIVIGAISAIGGLGYGLYRRNRLKSK